MKSIFKIILKTILYCIGFVALYCLFSLVIPLIKIPAEKTTEPKTIAMYLLTNGVHTDLVLPIKTETIDWSKKVSFKNTKSQVVDYQLVAFGWGDKGFYLNTPEWSDLKFSTAFKAAFWLSESAMHCTFHNNLTENSDCKKLLLTTSQYENLASYIDEKFQKDQNGNYIFIETEAVYGDNDAFYQANGTYSFLYTCNSWANYGLKAAGQDYALWTPTDFGIFRHFRK